MTTLIQALAAAAIGTMLASSASAQSAKDILGPTPFEPVASEPAPKLIVDPPLAEPLSRGAVVLQYRTENFHIAPVFGPGARDVSPRVGHLHVSVDDLPWHWADAGNTNTIVVVGLPPGHHKILIDLAGPDHHVYTGQTVSFTVPDNAARMH